MRSGLVLAVIFHILHWFALSYAAAQQIGIAPPPPDRWPAPRLVIATPIEQPVRIESVKVRGEIDGSLAHTEVEMVFRNPNNRILEGELQFPLLDGQSIAGFSMDVNGRLREAVPVEKARGQAVFEEIIRGRIDPGLLETTQGNNFKLRVYPIPANGTKQVVLRFTEPLRERKERLVYRLPLQYAERVESFQLDLRIAGAAQPPIAQASALGALELTSQGSYYVAQVSRAQFAGRGLLEIDIPRTSEPQVYTQTVDGRTYFYAEVPVSVRTSTRRPPRSVAILWDSSGSGAARDHDREFALLDAYFRRMGSGEARLVLLRDIAEATRTFRIVDGDWRALRAALTAVPYDGATHLGAFIPEPDVQEYLLFSDGLSNFGGQPFAETKAPLHAISAATRADPTWLRHVAHRSGGQFIDLTAEHPVAAMRRIATDATRVTAISGDGATALVLASPYAEDGRLRIAGELKQATATLALTLRHPGGRETSVQVPLETRGAISRHAAGQWARLSIAGLEAEYEINRAEIRRLGSAFGLVTRETSLIVLDRIEDYVRYEIVPPQELAADYERLRKVMVARRDADRSRHLTEVIRRFEEKAAWWQRDFPKDDRIAPSTSAKPAAGALSSMDARSREADNARLIERRRDAPAAPPAAARSAPAQIAREEGARENGLAKSAAQPGNAAATIRLAPWVPNAPYLDRMRQARKEDVYRVYLDERASHLASTAFFLDAADMLFSRELPDLAVRVLSNLAEMDLENRHILRILGHRLQQAGQPALAVHVFRKVLALSPEEPQSYRDLGLAYAADKQYQKAIDTLYEVVIRPWHNRFPEIELITLADLNAIVATAGVTLDTSRMHPSLLRNMPLDLRVVLTWDADNTDIDLWVTDPNGEKAYYGNRLTYQGGRMSQDYTGGYGPEEFSLKLAKPGRYRVQAQYYGDRRQAITGPTTMQVKLTTRFGLPQGQERMITLRLAGRSATVFVGEFEVESPAAK